ncbi:MAG: DUF4373 domain-containing protein [Tannerella sp.]|jgi:hypothetical protein|nr:DUF4373 domain-containing protein [Tannerella sp.]
MAKEAFYFPHDCNARNDEKLISVRMKYGAQGYGVYFMILERLMESTDHILVKDYNVIAFDVRVDSSIVKEIVENFGLFVFAEDGKYFYSESFNRRLKPFDNLREQRRQAGIKSAEKRAELSNRSTTVQRPLAENPTKESKVKNSKEKKEKLPKGSEKKSDLGKPEAEVKKAEQANKLAAAKAATKKRQEDFYNSLIPYVERYGPEMVRNFFDYWSEMNKSETKMKFELNKTWEVAKRLATWAKNNFDHERRNPNISNNRSNKGGIATRTNAQDARTSLEHLGELCDAILQQPSSPET